MGSQTAISWCDHTFNPWIGCARVSPGCLHCYAERQDRRLSRGEHWGQTAARRVTSEANWRKPVRWNRDAAEAGERRRVFCASLADVFEDRPDLIEPRDQLWDLIRETRHLDWLLLTKRPENLRRMLPWCSAGKTDDPWPNVWVGTTVEDQIRAEQRIPLLLDAPAALHWLSCEPLIAPVALTRWLRCPHCHTSHPPAFCARPPEVEPLHPARIDWVIVGGESGPGHRRMELDWALRIVAACREAGVAVHVKQLGDAHGRRHRETATFPTDLQIRQSPAPPDLSAQGSWEGAAP